MKSYGVTIQIKVTEQYLPVVLLIILYKVYLLRLQMKSWCDHSVKATEQYFPVVLFIMLYKVVQTFESVDETIGVTIQRKAN